MSAKPSITEIELASDDAIASTAGFKIFNRVLDWITNDRTQLINITDRINEIVRKSGVRDGIVHLQSLHTTTAVFLNEWQDALIQDVKRFLEDVVVREMDWRHNDPAHSDCERKNADSHLRGMMMGQTLSLQVRNSCVLLGTWQSIILAEFDGPRSRSMSVQVSGVESRPMPKRFTLAEAERLLPEIEKSIREAISLKSKYQDAEQEIQSFSQRVAMQGGMAIDRDAVLGRRTERDRIGDDLRAAVEQTEEFGCIIKDLDVGLIDFPTLFHGKEVYLCWKMGENGINHWHGVDEGFSGRKPIDAHFLENHTGDRAN